MIEAPMTVAKAPDDPAEPGVATRCDSCTARIFYHADCWAVPTGQDFVRIVCNACHLLGLR